MFDEFFEMKSSIHHLMFGNDYGIIDIVDVVFIHSRCMKLNNRQCEFDHIDSVRHNLDKY